MKEENPYRKLGFRGYLLIILPTFNIDSRLPSLCIAIPRHGHLFLALGPEDTFRSEAEDIGRYQFAGAGEQAHAFLRFHLSITGWQDNYPPSPEPLADLRFADIGRPPFIRERISV